MKPSSVLPAVSVTLRTLIVLNWVYGALIFSFLLTKEVLLRVSGNFNITGWLAIILLFVLAQVFLEGARMHDDLEGTV